MNYFNFCSSVNRKTSLPSGQINGPFTLGRIFIYQAFYSFGLNPTLHISSSLLFHLVDHAHNPSAKSFFMVNLRVWGAHLAHGKPFHSLTHTHKIACIVSDHTLTPPNRLCQMCRPCRGKASSCHQCWSPFSPFPHSRLCHSKTLMNSQM